MRTKRAIKNTVFNFASILVSIVCSFILPRLILVSFGSDYNGLTSSLRQFLNLIQLFHAGIGGVTMAALYKPLAENNREQISAIVKATEVFMRKIAFFFLMLAIAVALIYPFIVKEDFDWFFVFSLTLIISLNTFVNYLIGVPYSMVLQSDQRQSLLSIVSIVKTIANTVISAVMIQAGFEIRIVTLVAAIVFVVPPMFINFYVKKTYGIINNIKPDYSAIKQRWDNFGQQVANFVCQNTDLIILSIFSNIYEISVYTVYQMVMGGVMSLIGSLTKGIGAAFGNMFAKGEYKAAEANLRLMEQVVFGASTFFLSVTASTMVPFVTIYTKGVTDIEYIRPLFAYMCVASSLFQCYRLPYQVIVNAVGHFRQTRNAAFVEAGINVGLSLVLVVKFGIVGVIIGTLAAYIYRTVRYAAYMSTYIIRRSLSVFIRRVALSLVLVSLIVIITYFLPISWQVDYFNWVLNAFIISAISLVLVVSSEVLLYGKDAKMLFMKLIKNVGR